VPIRDNDPRPAYEQLADELRQAIRTGDYQPNDRLPSTRELADTHGIAPMTVRHALQTLQDEGLIVARQGRGVFVQQPPTDRPDAAPSAATSEASRPLDHTRQALEDARRNIDAALAALDAQRAPKAPTADPSAEPRDTVLANLAAAQADLAEVDAILDQDPAPDIEAEPPAPEPERGPGLDI
jgi:DNA-binding FadR family transcriptional regulator